MSLRIIKMVIERSLPGSLLEVSRYKLAGLEMKNGLSGFCNRSAHDKAGPTGLEPATSDVTGRRSNQLNYDPAQFRYRLKSALEASHKSEITNRNLEYT